MKKLTIKGDFRAYHQEVLTEELQRYNVSFDAWMDFLVRLTGRLAFDRWTTGGLYSRCEHKVAGFVVKRGFQIALVVESAPEALEEHLSKLGHCTSLLVKKLQTITGTGRLPARVDCVPGHDSRAYLGTCALTETFVLWSFSAKETSFCYSSTGCWNEEPLISAEKKVPDHTSRLNPLEHGRGIVPDVVESVALLVKPRYCQKHGNFGCMCPRVELKREKRIIPANGPRNRM